MQQDPNSRPATGYPYPYPYPNPPPQPAANGYPPNAGTAYPYQNHNPYFAPQQPHPRARLLRRLFIAFTTFLIILGLILFIFLLVARPQSPELYLSSLSVSNFNASNNQVTGKWDLQLRFRNPNSKMSLYYDTVFCRLYYNGESLSDTRLPPFDQGKKDETPSNATLSASGTYLDGKLVDSIGKERADKGSVEFDLRVDSWVIFRYGAFRRRRYVTFLCDDVAVGVPANSTSGKMIGLGKRCKSY